MYRYDRYVTQLMVTINLHIFIIHTFSSSYRVKFKFSLRFYMIFTRRIQTKLFFVNSRYIQQLANIIQPAMQSSAFGTTTVNQIPRVQGPSASKSYSLNLSARRFCHVIRVLNRSYLQIC